MKPAGQPRSLKLVGAKTILRPPRAGDAREFLKLNRASLRWHRHLVSPPKSTRDFGTYLERSRALHSRCFLICRKEDGAIVGSINLGHIVSGNLRNAYVGYYMGAPYAGKGYMTEALKLMLRYAFRILRLHRVEANIQPGNAASLRLVRRAGFRKEGFSPRYLKVCGRWRDHERWAILTDEWRKRNSRHSRLRARQGRWMPEL